MPYHPYALIFLTSSHPKKDAELVAELTSSSLFSGASVTGLRPLDLQIHLGVAVAGVPGARPEDVDFVSRANYKILGELGLSVEILLTPVVLAPAPQTGNHIELAVLRDVITSSYSGPIPSKEGKGTRSSCERPTQTSRSGCL